jgi:hypothetical protein
VDNYGGLLTYTGGWLDRAGDRRADANWLDELLQSPDTTLIPFWRDQCLVSGDPPGSGNAACRAGGRRRVPRA